LWHECSFKKSLGSVIESSQTQTVSGKFETDSQVESAANALVEAGIARAEIDLVSFRDAMSDAEAARGQDNVAVTVRTSDGRAEVAISILKQNGAANVSTNSALGEAKEEAELP